MSKIAIFGYPSAFKPPDGGVLLGGSPYNFQRMSMDGQGTKWRRKIAENFNRLSRVHERYRRQTDGRAIAFSEREREFTFAKRKGKEEYLYSAFYILRVSPSAQAWITQFYLQIHHVCLSFVSVHHMAPLLTEVRDIQLQLTTHLSTPKG